MTKKNQIIVEWHIIDISNEESWEYISLTWMISWLENKWVIIWNWLRSKSTLNFLWVREGIHNPNFNSIKFDWIRMEQWVPSFTMSVKKRIQATNAIWIVAKSWRYWWTYAHKDIAFEFASAISPEFKLFLIKEYERLKRIENNHYNLQRDVNRILAKVNYKVQTDAIKDYKIPISKYPKNKERKEYSDEADLLNIAIFWYTQKQWCKENQDLCNKGLNQREFASINENLVLSRMEIINAQLIEQWKDQEERGEYIKEKSKKMLEELNTSDIMKSLKRTDPSIYLDENKKSIDSNTS